MPDILERTDSAPTEQLQHKSTCVWWSDSARANSRTMRWTLVHVRSSVHALKLANRCTTVISTYCVFCGVGYVY